MRPSAGRAEGPPRCPKGGSIRPLQPFSSERFLKPDGSIISSNFYRIVIIHLLLFFFHHIHITYSPHTHLSPVRTTSCPGAPPSCTRLLVSCTSPSLSHCSRGVWLRFFSTVSIRGWGPPSAAYTDLGREGDTEERKVILRALFRQCDRKRIFSYMHGLYEHISTSNQRCGSPVRFVVNQYTPVVLL